MKNTAQAYTYGAAYVTGGKIAITKRVSIAGYPDDVTPGVTSLPTISFVIDAAQTSTTLGLTSSATSNLASLNYAGATSGVFLSITKNDVPGMYIKLVNNNAGAPSLSGTPVSSSLHTGVTSGILGSIGYDAASTTFNTSPIVTSLVSGTHFIGPNTAYANVFADVSTATTSETQAAAITNRSGWL